MDIVKKNLVSIVCGVVALLALVLTFFPMSGWFEELGTDLKKSSAAHDKMREYVGMQFNLPPIDLDRAEPGPLVDLNGSPLFPTNGITKEGVLLVGEMNKQSQALIRQVNALNRKTPLAPKALPSPRGGADASDFKRNFYATLNNCVLDMRATTPPSQFEVDKERDRVWQTEWAVNIFVGPDGQAKNERELKEKFDREVAPFIGDRLRADRAAKFSMYIAEPVQQQPGMAASMIPVAGANNAQATSLDYCVGIMPAPTDSALPKTMDIWAAQLSAWIQQDVVQAIHNTNKQSSLYRRGAASEAMPAVRDAIIKRLVRIEVPKEYITRSGPVAITTGPTYPNPMMARGGRFPMPNDPAAAANAAGPAPAEETTDGAVVREYKYTPTGRVCNSIYDVLHFTVIVDVDARYYPVFLSHLTGNRLITIRGIDFHAVDLEAALQHGFVYGPGPVMQVKLECEYVFLREWTKDLMPTEVRKLLTNAEAAANAATANAVPGR